MNGTFPSWSERRRHAVGAGVEAWIRAACCSHPGENLFLPSPLGGTLPPAARGAQHPGSFGSTAPAVLPARALELDLVLALLEAAGLPTEGVADGFPESYRVVRDASDGVIAVAGLEVHGDYGLLRSLAVRKDRRGGRLGAALTASWIAEAGRRGLAALFGLTTTAADYFTHLGFERVARESVPEAVLKSGEFAHVCPANATVLRMELTGRDDAR